MSNLFVHVGCGEYVSARHALALIQPGSVTAKRRVSAARKIGQYIDTSHGKGIKCYILLDENTVVASHISTKTLAARFVDEFDKTGDSESYNGMAQVHMVDSDVDVEDEDLPFTDIYDTDDDEEDEDDSTDDDEGE